MRSHMIPLSPSPNLQKTQEESEEEEVNGSSPSYFASEEEDGGEGGKGQAQYYGLRENPKKSFRLVDPEFSFAIDAVSVVQDRESETESSKIHLRRRSKRKRRSIESFPNPPEPDPEPEPVSSVSNTTPEEDVALSLMMLSRDIWMRDCRKLFDESEEENQEDEDEEEEEELKFFSPRGRNKYQCETCKKVFRSYQALGGHRSSHKKIRNCWTPSLPGTRFRRADSTVARNAAGNGPGNLQIHQCPVCLRVFKSGQALGGHKRSHMPAFASASASASASVSAASPSPTAYNMIDLNLPAPIEEDEDFSQVELSAVSDADFVHPAK